MLSETELRFLTKEQRERLADLEGLFGSPGWQRFVKEMAEAAIKIRNNAINLLSEQELFMAKGQVSMALGVVNFEQSVEAEYKNIVTDAELRREEERASLGSNA